MHFTSSRVLACATLLAYGVTAALIPFPVLNRILPTSTTTASASAQASSSASSTLSSLTSASPTVAAPTAASQLNAGLQAIYTATSANFANQVASQVAAGLVGPTGTSLGGIVESLYGPNPLLPTGENSITNNNPRNPATAIYPKKAASDASYSLTESQLRAALYIPPTFTYGAKTPVLFVPGTASYGGSAFRSNLRKLLTNVPYADPVWLNIPGASLGDIQVNSEYVAYALNYISGISQNRNVSAISWSQGGINVQWALTYWPSTRAIVSDFIPVAADFHGTVLSNALACVSPGGAGALQLNVALCTPAFAQQEYNSALITALRARGGGAAYVPTTSVYSGFFDEVVQPQSGTGASAFLQQNPSGSVTNNEVQIICPVGSPGAGFYGHVTTLYHPLTYALVVDALTHDGPGLVSRLDVASVCSAYSAPGLTIADNLETAALIPAAAVLDLTYVPKVLLEPPLKAYAAA